MLRRLKEIIVDYSKSPNEFTPVYIKDDSIKLVEEYK